MINIYQVRAYTFRVLQIESEHLINSRGLYPAGANLPYMEMFNLISYAFLLIVSKTLYYIFGCKIIIMLKNSYILAICNIFTRIYRRRSVHTNALIGWHIQTMPYTFTHTSFISNFDFLNAILIISVY